jgi:hypothetical protein
MNVALLCPGPSLATLEESPPADITIGVNRAACRFPVTWWAATDYPLIRGWGGAILGNPKLFTRRQTWLDVRRRINPPTVMFTEALSCPVKGWDVKTATAALVLAGNLGATRIDVYGADWTDAPDFDGVEVVGTDRKPQRWDEERATWHAVIAHLGIPVTRHGIS